jgi:endonuclease/exonuclease/phosphatase family metal-dependent hydrolase
MRPRFKKVLTQSLFFLTLLCGLLLILSNLAGRLDPARWWPVSILGLFFPVLLAMNIVACASWLFVKPRNAIIPLTSLIISIPLTIASFPLHLRSFSTTKGRGQLRIVTWNVGLMNYSAPNEKTAIAENKKIIDALYGLDADVICLQEFFTAVIPDKKYNFIDSFARHLHFPYSFFSRDHPKFDGKFYSGTIIFSKYPIADSSKIIFPGAFGGSIIRAGLLVNNDTIDVLTTRLQNINFREDDYETLQEIKRASGRAIPGSGNIISKLRYGYAERARQVKSVQALMDRSSRPLIFTGDINDVPASYAYTNIKREMKDAWVKKGSGFGRTFRFIFPTLRIDHIFFDHSFKAVQVTRILGDASDHYGVVADLQPGQ